MTREKRMLLQPFALIKKMNLKRYIVIREFFFGPIRLINSILSFGSWISVLQKDITENIKCYVKMTEQLPYKVSFSRF